MKTFQSQRKVAGIALNKPQAASSSLLRDRYALMARRPAVHLIIYCNRKMLSQQQYTKELAETERYYNSEARRQPSANDNNNNNVGGSSPNNDKQYTNEETEAYNTIINNIKDPQELYQILHKMKQKRLHRTNTNNNNNKPRRHRYQRQRRSKSKRRVSRSSSGSSEDTPTLDVPSSTTESSTTFHSYKKA